MAIRPIGEIGPKFEIRDESSGKIVPINAKKIPVFVNLTNGTVIATL